MKPVVYIASAYTKGDVAVNVNFQCKMFDELLSDGLVWPVVPLWSHFQHTIYPRPSEDWISYDHALIPRYDACLRLTATNSRVLMGEGDYIMPNSSGADNEVVLFKSLGRPVFFSKVELYDWVRSFPY